MDQRRGYFREWRRKKGLTQKQVADRLSGLDDPDLPITEASLSRIENGTQNYKSNLLYALADIYGCEAADLLGRHPDRAGQLIDLLERMDPETRAMAETMVTALAEHRQPYIPPDPDNGRLAPKPDASPRRMRKRAQ